MKYRIKEGLVLPSKFKIKVNKRQTKVLQKYLFSQGYDWFSQRLESKFWVNAPFIFAISSDKIEYSVQKNVFYKHDALEIKFKDYFKKGKKSIRKITSKNQMYDNLIAMQYDPRIAEELCGIWAEHVNGAYRRGFEKGLAGENNWYIPRSDCKPLSVYDHDDIYIGNGKGTSTPFGPTSVNMLGRKGFTDAVTPQGPISYERHLSETEKEDNGTVLIDRANGKVGFLPGTNTGIPLLQFIEKLHPTIKMKGVLIIDTEGMYYNELLTYIYEMSKDISNKFMKSSADKFSTKMACCYIDGIEVTVIDAREKPLFIGKELAQWQ